MFRSSKADQERARVEIRRSAPITADTGGWVLKLKITTDNSRGFKQDWFEEDKGGNS